MRINYRILALLPSLLVASIVGVNDITEQLTPVMNQVVEGAVQAVGDKTEVLVLAIQDTYCSKDGVQIERLCNQLQLSNSGISEGYGVQSLVYSRPIRLNSSYG